LLKYVLNKYGVMIDVILLRIGTSGGLYEHGKEPSVSIAARNC
jgi:hypothetical protein